MLFFYYCFFFSCGVFNKFGVFIVKLLGVRFDFKNIQLNININTKYSFKQQKLIQNSNLKNVIL